MCDTATSHTCLLCMGSNLDALLHLKNAEDALQRLFPDIEWGGIVETVPEKMENPQPFLNRAARFRTSLPMTEVRSILKQIEQTDGLRTARRKDASRLTLTCFPTTSRYSNRRTGRKNMCVWPFVTPVSRNPDGYSALHATHIVT